MRAFVSGATEKCFRISPERHYTITPPSQILCEPLLAALPRNAFAFLPDNIISDPTAKRQQQNCNNLLQFCKVSPQRGRRSFGGAGSFPTNEATSQSCRPRGFSVCFSLARLPSRFQRRVHSPPLYSYSKEASEVSKSNRIWFFLRS